MNLEQIRRLVILAMGEMKDSISLSPVQYGNMLHQASLKHFKRKLGLPEEYRPGMPLPSQAFEITQRITEDLRPFKVMRGWDVSTPLIVDKTGRATYPDDYYYVSTLSFNYISSDDVLEREIDVLSDLEYQKRVSSLNEKPDFLFPISNLQAKHIRFAPKTLGYANMVYLKLPKAPVYAVTEARGYYEYDEENSVQLEWDEMNIIDIITLFLFDIGIKIEKPEVLNYANQIKERGI